MTSLSIVIRVVTIHVLQDQIFLGRKPGQSGRLYDRPARNIEIEGAFLVSVRSKKGSPFICQTYINDLLTLVYVDSMIAPF